VCIGCSASIKQTDLVLTQANVTQLDPLEPIPQAQLAATLASWKVTSDATMQLLFYELSGGVPRVLRSAACWSHPNTGFLLRHPANSYMVGFDSWVTNVHSLYPVDTAQRPLSTLYALYLQSCTKWPFTTNPREMHVLPNGMTYATAMEHSLCTIRHDVNRGLYFVAASPIVLCGQLGTSTTWPMQPHDLLSLDAYQAVLRAGAVDTGVPFERVLIHDVKYRSHPFQLYSTTRAMDNRSPGTTPSTEWSCRGSRPMDLLSCRGCTGQLSQLLSTTKNRFMDRFCLCCFLDVQ